MPPGGWPYTPAPQYASAYADPYQQYGQEARISRHSDGAHYARCSLGNGIDFIGKIDTGADDCIVSPEIMQKVLSNYGKVRDNLLKHAPGFPAVEDLSKLVKAGPFS